MADVLQGLWSSRLVVTEDAWRGIYDKMLPKVFHFFAYRVGDRHLAEDLTSSTFERAWRARSQFDPDRGDLDNWIFGIARNIVIDHYRGQKTALALDEVAALESGSRPESDVDEKDDFDRLSRLLAEQSDRRRELISLKYGASLTNRRIAEITGLTETNVGTILHRTVAELRERWEAQDE